MTSPSSTSGDDLILHVIHTNDFHGTLHEEGASVLRAAIAGLNGQPYVLLDAGDAIKAGNVGVNPFGEPILDLMSDLGYHAMTMGNREFHVWRQALETKINRARFPILSANVRARVADAAPLPVQPLAKIDAGGIKVVVLGVTVPMVTERMKVAPLSSFVFDEPIESITKLIAQERWGADIIIALTHIGLREDEKLAARVSGVDLIVGGHSHIVVDKPDITAKTPIVQGGSHGRWYGHVRLRIGSGGVAVESAQLLPLQKAPSK